MPLDARSLLLGWLLPAAAGAGAGLWLKAPPSAAPANTVPPGHPDAVKLPEDPAIIRLAALAGRTADARIVIGALVRKDAADEDIAAWLAPVLIGEPAWLETFILSIPEERRVDLIRATLWTMSELSPDSVWRLIRSSPAAAEAARTTGSGAGQAGLDVISTCRDSTLAAEVLLDPAKGFPKQDIAEFFRWGSRNRENSRRILEAWASGFWEGDPPECVRSAWAHLHREDRSALGGLEEKLPDALKESAARFDAYARLMQGQDGATGTPAPEELAILGAEELAAFTQDRAESGMPVPLATLAALPRETRSHALEGYFGELYPFHADLAGGAVDSLDRLGFAPEEKQVLLDGAVHHVWNHEGDHGTALRWASRMPDPEARAAVERYLLEDLARHDPAAALDVVETLPAGKLRAAIEKLAARSRP